MDRVEKVARAIMRAKGAPQDQWEIVRAQAEAAIEACAPVELPPPPEFAVELDDEPLPFASRDSAEL